MKSIYSRIADARMRYQAGHDVSGEARDETGEWTAGGAAAKPMSDIEEWEGKLKAAEDAWQAVKAAGPVSYADRMKSILDIDKAKSCLWRAKKGMPQKPDPIPEPDKVYHPATEPPEDDHGWNIEPEDDSWRKNNLSPAEVAFHEARDKQARSEKIRRLDAGRARVNSPEQKDYEQARQENAGKNVGVHPTQSPEFKKWFETLRS